MGAAQTGRQMAEIKLDELRRQQERLVARYDEILAEAGRAPGGRERLEVLVEGLSALGYAGRSLHPEAGNLGPLRAALALGVAPEPLLACWLERMERELRDGRRRAIHGGLVGRLLGEWAVRPERERAETGGERPSAADSVCAAFLARAAEPASPPLERLERLMEAHRARLDEIGAAVRAYGADPRWQRISAMETRSHLLRLAGSPYRAPSFRMEARRIASDEVLLGECASVVTLMLGDPERWAWPEAGVPVRTLWARSRWRTFLDDTLLRQVVIEAIGTRWSVVLGALARERAEPPLACALDPLPEAGSVLAVRESWLDALFLADVPRDLGELESSRYHRSLGERYDQDGAADGAAAPPQRVLLALHAEITLLRLAHPGAPITVVATDLRDFFPSFPHALARRLLAALGMPEPWIETFEQLLRVRMRGPDGSVVEARRGLPLEIAISPLLAELWLRILDAHVHEVSGVRLLRFVDDIAFATADPEQAVRAWRALCELCADCGIEISEEKSGAVGIGCDKPADLPARALRWGLLSLGPDGGWTIDEAALERSVTTLAARLDRPEQPVLAQVALYNSYVRRLVSSLAPALPLGPSHERAIGQAVARLRTAVGGRSMVEHCLALIRERHGEQGLDALPVGWVHWPLGSGGLGLCDPLLLLTPFDRRAPAPIAPREREPDWLWRSRPWGRCYQQAGSALPAQHPARTARLASLLDAFVQQGSALGRPQSEIGAYWEWVIQIYGQQLVDHFGSFGFLLPELVPVQLIAWSRLITASVDKGMEEAASLVGEVDYSVSISVSSDASDDDIPF